MNTLPPQGTLPVIHLPGTGSLLMRSAKIYTRLFRQLVVLSALVLFVAIAQYGITSFLHFIVRDAAQVWRAVMQVLGTALSLGLGFFFAWMFAAFIYLTKNRENVAEATWQNALARGGTMYQSMFFAGALAGLAIYGSVITLILPLFFSVWFYFAGYIIVNEGKKGIDALLRSHYLVRGVWWKTMGRGMVLVGLLGVAYSIVYLSMGIPVIGWWVYLLLVAVLGLFAVPFYVVYDQLRYEDLTALSRSLEFQSFTSRRVEVIAWSILGTFVVCLGWGVNLLGCDARAAVQNTVRLAIGSVQGGLGVELSKNTTELTRFMNKITFVYDPGCRAPANAAGSVLPSSYLPTIPSTTTPTGGTPAFPDLTVPDEAQP